MTTCCNNVQRTAAVPRYEEPATMTDGYVKAPHDIIRDPSISAMAKVAWLLIAGMPVGYHPTREQWMAMLPCGDKRTWWKTVMELQQAGLIEVSNQGTKKIYTAVQSGVKSHPLRVENNTGKGCETTPVERCEITPIKKNIEEQENNNPVDVRARLREEVTQDAMVEMGCMSVGISTEEYHSLAQEIFNDWTFQDTPDSEWTKNHFLSVLRIKAREQRRNDNNGTVKQPIAAGRADRAAAIARTMATLGTQGSPAEKLPF